MRRGRWREGGTSNIVPVTLELERDFFGQDAERGEGDEMRKRGWIPFSTHSWSGAKTIGGRG